MAAALATDVTRVLELVADGVRLVGAVSVPVALVRYDGIAAAVLGLALLGLVLARALQLHPVLDLVAGVSVLAAAWSSILRLYEEIGWWDLAAHGLCTGVLAAMSVAALTRLFAWPPASAPSSGAGRWRVAVVVLATAAGLALSVLWELGEWAGHTLLDPEINVGYADTMADLAAGGLGSLAAGGILAARGSVPLRTSEG